MDPAALAAVCDKYGVSRLHVFGSVARGTANRESDIDVLYELLPGRRLGWEIEDFSDELARLFGRTVDLVSAAGLNALLKPVVLAEARPLYAA